MAFVKTLPSILPLLLLLLLVLSAPLSVRATCVDTCGSVCYWASDISEAQAQGWKYHTSGQTLGSNAYPHVFNDNEDFHFAVSGPYHEFPILKSYIVYTGGSPGPDRVVFNAKNQLAGLVTHTGASGNKFAQCKT